MRRKVPPLLVLFSLAVYFVSPIATASPSFPSADFMLAVVAAAIGMVLGIHGLTVERNRHGAEAVLTAAVILGAAFALTLWGLFVIGMHRNLDILAG
jgi:hypothetical protein